MLHSLVEVAFHEFATVFGNTELCCNSVATASSVMVGLQIITGFRLTSRHKVVNQMNEITVSVGDASSTEDWQWARYPEMVEHVVINCYDRIQHGLVGTVIIEDVDDKRIHFSNAEGTVFFIRYFLESVSERGYTGHWSLFRVGTDDDSLDTVELELPYCTYCYYEYNWSALCGVSEEEYNRIKRMARASGLMNNCLNREILAKLIETKGVVEGPDLFALQFDKLAYVGLSREKAQVLIEAIQVRKTMSLARFLWCLGIDGISWQVAKSLSEQFQHLDDLRSANADMIASTSGTTPEQAATIASWLCENSETIEKLLTAGVTIVTEPVVAPETYFAGLTFRFHGKLKSLTRKLVSELVTNSGGKVVTSSQRRTDYLVVPRKYDVENEYFTITGDEHFTIAEDDFLLMLHDSQWHKITDSTLDSALEECEWTFGSLFDNV